MKGKKRTPKAETYHAVTEDGWKIALHRYRRGGSRRLPVLLVHGLASNRHNFDFPQNDISFAKYLWAQGWDTWVVELRGAGRSTRPKGWEWMKKGWNVDHYVLQDLPAAVKFVLKQTGKKKLHWVGHSLGGLLVSPFINTHKADSLQSAVLAASPVTGIPKYLHKWTYLAEPLLKILPFVPYKTMAKFLGLQPEWIFRGPVPKLFVSDNMDLKTIKRGSEIAVDDLSNRVILQFQDWMRSKTFHSEDKKIRYHANFKNMVLPLLLISGSHDPFTPVDEVKRTFRRLGSKKKSMIVFGKEFGHAADYSHWDLILGRHARNEVYPAIEKWLSENDER